MNVISNKISLFFVLQVNKYCSNLALGQHHCPGKQRVMESLNKKNRKPASLTIVATWQYWQNLILLRSRVKYLVSYVAFRFELSTLYLRPQIYILRGKKAANRNYQPDSSCLDSDAHSVLMDRLADILWVRKTAWEKVGSCSQKKNSNILPFSGITNFRQIFKWTKTNKLTELLPQPPEVLMLVCTCVHMYLY